MKMHVQMIAALSLGKELSNKYNVNTKIDWNIYFTFLYHIWYGCNTLEYTLKPFLYFKHCVIPKIPEKTCNQEL